MNKSKNNTLLYFLKNYHELRYKRELGTLENTALQIINTLEEMFVDQELLHYRNSAFSVLVYHYRDGISYEEIAEKMYIGVSTVYKYRKYALERISDVFNIPIE